MKSRDKYKPSLERSSVDSNLKMKSSIKLSVALFLFSYFKYFDQEKWITNAIWCLSQPRKTKAYFK